MASILHLPDQIGPHKISDWEPIAGDASSRRYWRVTIEGGVTAVLCRYPDQWRSIVKRDLEVLVWLRERGISVPSILVGRADSVWVLLEDLGPVDGEQALRETPPASRAARAVGLTHPLFALAALPVENLPDWNPALEQAFLRWELAGFELWCLGATGQQRPARALQSWLDHLAASISDHPQGVCLRDFHINNILLRADSNVGVIDVQDIRRGPDTYDLASFLSDRAMPELLSPRQRRIVAQHWADEVGALPGWDRRLEATTLQRALKVLGTFTFLCAKGMHHYRRWIPTTATTAAELAKNLGAPAEAMSILLDLAATGGFDVW
ncbi:MAG: phosphotransferase [Acidobacteriota bacterium]